MSNGGWRDGGMVGLRNRWERNEGKGVKDPGGKEWGWRAERRETGRIRERG